MGARTIVLTALSGALLFTACVEERIEGTEPGDCSDGADNDADGLFDCDDPNCAGAPACSPRTDAGSDPDAGAREDAGLRDAGDPGTDDAGSDAGSTGTDAGTRTCSSLDFGPNRYGVAVPHDPALSIGDTPGPVFTVELWAFIRTPNQNARLVTKRPDGTSSTQTDYIIFLESGRLYWGTGSVADSCAWMSVPEPTASEWHHIAATIDTTTARKTLYIDGQLAFSCGYAIKAAANSNELRIGGYLDSGVVSWAFDGRIDEVRLSSIVRYDSDFTPATSLSADADTIALYTFDEGTGTTAADSSSNGFDGDIQEATWVSECPGP